MLYGWQRANTCATERQQHLLRLTDEQKQLLDLPQLNDMQVQGDNSKNPVLVNSTKLTHNNFTRLLHSCCTKNLHRWQSQVENKHYSIAHFACIVKLKVQYLQTSMKGVPQCEV